jgi:hypothetical protein
MINIKDLDLSLIVGKKYNNISLVSINNSEELKTIKMIGYTPIKSSMFFITLMIEI